VEAITMSKTTAPAAPPVDEPRIPSIEDRLFDVKRALALGMLTARAVSQAGDLGLEEDTTEFAYGQLCCTFQDALAGVQSIQAVLPGDVCAVPAPEVQ